MYLARGSAEAEPHISLMYVTYRPVSTGQHKSLFMFEYHNSHFIKTTTAGTAVK